MVFGLFSKERAIKRAHKKAQNRLAQSADRWAALERLRDHGDEEALYTLCKRFSFKSLKSVEDEQEKAWVVETLIQKGEQALVPLRRFMLNTPHVALPLRVLEASTRKEKALEVIDELLEAEAPGYTNDTSKRISYIDWLAEWNEASDDEVTARVVPYLEDYDENVRFKAVEALSLRGTEDAAEPLVAALLREEEESKRLKLRIAEVLCDRELSIGEHKKELKPMLEDLLSDYRFQRDKLAKKIKN